MYQGDCGEGSTDRYTEHVQWERCAEDAHCHCLSIRRWCMVPGPYQKQKGALLPYPRCVASYFVKWGPKHREVICFFRHTQQVESKEVKAPIR